ncbi:hypothetical protein JFU02_02375 [Bacillus sp. TH13]|nr:hypothetical protein [Bacillus sp. TH13]
MLNTAVESRGLFPKLQSAAKTGFDDTVILLESVLKEGIEKQEFTDEMDTLSLASFLSSSMEGAIMANQVCNDNIHHHYFLLTSYSK